MWNIGYPVNWSAPLNRELIGWWIRPPVLVSNARWLNLSGKNHGTFVNSPTWSGATHPGGWGSLDFNGTTQRVNLSTGLRPTTAVSIAFWLHWDANVSAGIVYALNYNAGAYYGFNIYLGSGGTLYWRAGQGNSGDAFNQINVGTDNVGVWVHFVVTWSNNVTAVYKNGKSLTVSGVTDATAIAYTGVGDLLVGSEPSSAYLNGQLNDLRMYSRVLVADEVMRLYTASKTGYHQELNWIEDDDILHSGVPGKGGFLSFPLLIPIRYPRVMLL